MPGRLAQEVRQRRPMPPEEEAYGNLLRTASLLLTEEERCLEPHGLTSTQHNVLRILRGARPDGLRVGGIMERLVTPHPDGTRLVDRLVQKGMAERRPDPDDGRAVRVHATGAGLEVLAGADRALGRLLRAAVRGIGEARLSGMVEVLEAIRGNVRKGEEGG